MGWIDKLLSVGSAFDWISPLYAIGKDISSGPHATFVIHDRAGYSVRQIESFLRAAGVVTWGCMLEGRDMRITVRKQDVRAAERVLSRWL
jgi:hypothetical protein